LVLAYGYVHVFLVFDDRIVIEKKYCAHESDFDWTL